MPGIKTYGYHEGSRSEYLAQYAFASWGTAVVIPQQEDHGLDLHCTLMQRIGRRLLAKSPYTVQVKSEMKPVVFDGKEAVRWVIKHPLPLFLCIVDKASVRLSIYHTLARFHAWSLGQWPDQLSMIPKPATPGKEGKCAQWPAMIPEPATPGKEKSYHLSLDQPILDFSVNEMLDETFWQKASQLFEQWVEVENENLTRVRTRLPTCRVPDRYKTNEPLDCGWETLSLAYPNEEQFEQTTAYLKESLEWVGEQLRRKGDLCGAGKAALVHRHLFRNDRGCPLSLVQSALNDRLQKDSYVYAGVDYLAEVVQKPLDEASVNGSA